MTIEERLKTCQGSWHSNEQDIFNGTNQCIAVGSWQHITDLIIELPKLLRLLNGIKQELSSTNLKDVKLANIQGLLGAFEHVE